LEQAVEVYDKLKAGQITGRAVLIPDGAQPSAAEPQLIRRELTTKATKITKEETR